MTSSHPKHFQLEEGLPPDLMESSSSQPRLLVELGQDLEVGELLAQELRNLACLSEHLDQVRACVRLGLRDGLVRHPLEFLVEVYLLL